MSEKSRLTISDKAFLFVAYTNARRTFLDQGKEWPPKIGVRTGVSDWLRAEDFSKDVVPSHQCYQPWFKKWDRLDGRFTAAEDREESSQNARKVTSSVSHEIKETLLAGASLRAAANYSYWDEESETYLELSVSCIHKLRQQELGMASPKQVYVILTPHHKRFRVLYAQQQLALPANELLHTGFSDESGFGLGVAPNTQNDVVYCEKSHESWTNLILVSKSDLKNVLNLFIFVTFEGIPFFHIYAGEFSVAVYADILRLLTPIVARLRRRRVFSSGAHDHCMKGAKPVAALDACFGVGNWGRTPAPPCKNQIGEREVPVAASVDGKRKAYTRTIGIYEPRDPCDCDFEDGTYAAKIPDLNLAENAFNQIRAIMYRLQREEGKARSAEQLRERIESAVAELHDDKAWFTSAFASLPERYRTVVELEGDLTSY